MEKNKENETEVLEKEYMDNNCNDVMNMYNKTCNKFLLKKELLETDYLKENPDKNEYLYPSLNDPNFIVKIAEKKEFNDTKYDGTIYNLKEHSDELGNIDFELSPHQAFVKNFLSYQTPYNSLLLYHGLGTGKTCSAIGVCEEQREYLNQMGIKRRSIIVASPNVQDSFNLQLFDERKLKKINGVWNIRGCTGNKLLNEINPMKMKGVSREKVITQIKNIIHNSYLFMGYLEFANYIERTQDVKGEFKSDDERTLRMIRKLKNEFDGRLIVIDEVHNIRLADDSETKRVAQQLQALVSIVSNMRLLLLSATPMYNNYTEIVWLLNLMNMNDKRSKILTSDIFNKKGEFKKNREGEVGKDLLIRKATGYISFVRGENPYTFPYRVFPNIFSIENTFEEIQYPKYQVNGKEIETNNPNEITKTQLYLTEIGSYQEQGYNKVLENISKDSDFKNLDRFGYMLLQKPLDALNIVFPIHGDIDSSTSYTLLTGKKGLANTMDFRDNKNPPEKGSFEYKDWVLERYGRIFSPERVGLYSSKIKNICNNILSESGKVGEGVILIYSQNLDSGLIPMALALEEMGFTRYGQNANNLFSTPPTTPINSKDLKPIDKKSKQSTAKYIMITGDPRISPNNDYEVKGVTLDDNTSGDKIKVILISRAGSEGIDFKFIRQIHIMDPWYNFSRIEQIIGRGVRSFSHKLLPFEKRNVEIFLHGSILSRNEYEALDLYVYRIASIKAKQIGEVARVLKESSVDCLINEEQQNFTQENIAQGDNKDTKQILSNGVTIDDFKVGDTPYTAVCDYMGSCNYKCIPSKDITSEDTNSYTYNKSYVMSNSEKLFKKIRELFRENFFYKKDDLIKHICTPKTYPITQIYGALSQLINDETEFIIDRYGRSGHLVNIGEYYMFQPNEINNNNITLFDRSIPLDYKPKTINIKMDNTILDAKRESIREIQDEILTGESKSVLSIMQQKYDEAINQMNNKQDIPRGTTDWYIHCGKTMETLMDEYRLSELEVKVLLVHHLVDMLVYKDKLTLINLIYQETSFETDSFTYMIKEYLDSMLIQTNRDIMIILYENEEMKTWLFKNNKWVLGGPEDEIDAKNIFETKLEKENREINNMIGFMGYEQKNDYMIFKVKEMDKKRTTGARCDEAPKSKRLTTLNLIIGEERYNKENTKKMVQQQLCCLQEFLCRYYNQIDKHDNYWFFNYEKSMLLKEQLQI
jgi:hypothetical protein